MLFINPHLFYYWTLIYKNGITKWLFIRKSDKNNLLIRFIDTMKANDEYKVWYF